ncbi:immunoglobulin domain-containing protein [Cytophagaceae bacterium ABcell3]|nr:immunoglobulin domain-containing protein [Cytophagaceae bacterium ABcell3]
MRKRLCNFWVFFLTFVLYIPTSYGQSEYSWGNVEIVAGGFLTGIVYHPTEQGLAYARTDMGGAYRLDGTTRRWEPLTDVFDADDWNMMGIESMAIDPTDPDRVYMACGTYAYHDWAGNASFFSSTDRGETWERTYLDFKLGANEDGRGMGERLALDPNAPETLYLGTRQNGLYKSTNRGANWSQVSSFPNINTPRDVGLGFVVIDAASGSPGNPSQVIYVGVARNDGTNLYRSTDGGESWEGIPGAPTGIMPYQAKLASNGTLYISYTDAPGPNDIDNGAVYKFNTQSEEWTRIKAPDPDMEYGFGGIAVDPNNPNTIMVGSICRWWPYDQMYRSTDGGDNWIAVGTGRDYINRDVSASPYIRWGNDPSEDNNIRTGNWISALAIDPFDSDRVLYATGATVWGCDEISNADDQNPIKWEIRAQGVEQTAILSLASPNEGPSLLSGIGDICGFVHNDIRKSPEAGMIDPAFKDGVGVDFAELNPSVFAIIGHDYEPVDYMGAISTDAGENWTRFENHPADMEDGMIALSADGEIIIWAPENQAPYRSVDGGSQWTQVNGIGGTATLVSDRVNSNKFYAIRSNTFYRSTDGGVNFSAAATSGFSGTKLKAVPGYENHIWVPANNGLYHSSNGGDSFERNNQVQSADVVGFGKAAPGQEYPAIFITGSVNNTYGIYRSDDAGENWVRINNDLNQFGAINTAITGDPRVYGRVYVATNGRGIILGEVASEECEKPKITAFSQIEDKEKEQVNEVVAPLGSNITLSVETTEEGTWEWTGPDELISDNESLTVENFSSEVTGTYAASFTNVCGKDTTVSFILSLCDTNTISPMVIIGENEPEENKEISISEGKNLTLSPVASDGKWEWIDINGSSESTREISFANIGMESTGNYEVNFTNECGAQSSLTYSVHVIAKPVVESLPTEIEVSEGEAITLEVIATGSGTLSYQWYHNEMLIENATSATLEIESSRESDSGIWHVAITDEYGGVTTSDNIEVIVKPAIDCNGDEGGTAEIDECDVCAGGETGIEPGYTCAEPEIESISEVIEVEEGEALTLTVTASGPDELSYQWFRNGQAIEGATDATYTVTEAAVSDAGSYQVVVSNENGDTQSASVEVSIIQGVDCNGDEGGTAYIDDCDVCAGGNTGIEPGFTCADPTVEVISSDINVEEGEDFTLEVSVSGPGENTYQWFKEGEPIEGAIESTYTVTSASGSDAGSYHVFVTNDNGATTSDPIQVSIAAAPELDCNGDENGTAEIDECDVCAGGNTGIEPGFTCAAPTVEVVSSDINVEEGEDFTLEVSVSGPGENTYQWFKDGEPIEGATESTYTVPSASVADAGSYYVVVTNDNGSVTSDEIHVNVSLAVDCNGVAGGTAEIDECGECAGGDTGIEPGSSCPVVNPEIISIPTALEATLGEPFELNVNASGPGSFTYQWYHNNQPINGATNSTYSVEETSEEDAGTYHVVITSSNGGETKSEEITLTVTQPVDCNDDIWGDAFYDVCGICAGGNTGIEPTLDEDECVTSINGEELGAKVNVYPNPASTELFVEYQAVETKTLTLLNGLGQVVRSVNSTNTVDRFDISDLPSGVYLLVVEYEGKVQHAKIVVQ